MLDPALLPSVSGRLTADDFYSERHRILYRTMLVLQETGTEIDLRTLQASLEQQDRLENGEEKRLSCLSHGTSACVATARK